MRATNRKLVQSPLAVVSPTVAVAAGIAAAIKIRSDPGHFNSRAAKQEVLQKNVEELVKP